MCDCRLQRKFLRKMDTSVDKDRTGQVLESSGVQTTEVALFMNNSTYTIFEPVTPFNE